MEPNVIIERGQDLIITTKESLGNNKIVSTSYKNLPMDCKVGDMILIDDGKIELKVKEVRSDDVLTEVVYGGSIEIPERN